MAKQAYKISEFRSAIRMVNYIRSDFCGHVEHERLRADLRARYAPHIQELKEMIPTLQKRYADDLSSALYAIEQAEKQIDLNEASQREFLKAGNAGHRQVFDPDYSEQRKAASVH